VPKILLDKATHTYTVDGVQKPSVTQILEEMGFIDKSFYTLEGRQIGEAVHVCCELLDRGIPFDWDALDPRVSGRVKAYVNFKEVTGFEPELIEHMVYNPELDHAGSLDRTGKLNRKRITIDFKSGMEEPWHKYQVWAYDLCPDVQTGRPFGLYLKKTGTYNLVHYSDPSTISEWKKITKEYHLKQKEN
jgi:hypothetical protein